MGKLIIYVFDLKKKEPVAAIWGGTWVHRALLRNRHVPNCHIGARRWWPVYITKCIWTHTHTQTHTQTHRRTDAQHTDTHTHTHTHTHAQTHTHRHTQAHTHLYIYKYIRVISHITYHISHSTAALPIFTQLSYRRAAAIARYRLHITYTHTLTHTHLHTHTYTHAHKYTHARKHTYIYVYTNTSYHVSDDAGRCCTTNTAKKVIWVGGSDCLYALHVTLAHTLKYVYIYIYICGCDIYVYI